MPLLKIPIPKGQSCQCCLWSFGEMGKGTTLICANVEQGGTAEQWIATAGAWCEWEGTEGARIEEENWAAWGTNPDIEGFFLTFDFWIVNFFFRMNMRNWLPKPSTSNRVCQLSRRRSIAAINSWIHCAWSATVGKPVRRDSQIKMRRWLAMCFSRRRSSPTPDITTNICATNSSRNGRKSWNPHRFRTNRIWLASNICLPPMNDCNGATMACHRMNCAPRMR